MNKQTTIINNLIFLSFPFLIFLALLCFPFRYLITVIKVRKCIKIVKDMKPHECFFRHAGEFLILPNQQIHFLHHYKIEVFSTQNYGKMSFLQKEEFCRTVQVKYRHLLSSLEKQYFKKDVQKDIEFCLERLPILTEKNSLEMLLTEPSVEISSKRIKI